MTTPVVPRIDRPPMMPRRPLAVRSAILSPPGTEISTIASTPTPCRSRDFREIGLDHRARRRVDRGLARRKRQSGPRHRADALAGLEAQSGAWAREAHGRHDERAMGDVRIVARVLDDAGAGKIGPKLMGREREFGPQALRQRDRNGVRKGAGQKRFEGRARRAARAGAGRPPAPQGRLLRLAHERWPSARGSIRLVVKLW